MCKLSKVHTALKMNITTEASKLMSEDEFDVRKGSNLKIAEMMNSFVNIDLLNIFIHHFIRKYAYVCLKWILHLRTTLQTSHLRPFNNSIYSLNRNSYSECKGKLIEQLPDFIKITYAETLSDKQWTGTTNRNRILLENVPLTRMQ